MARHCVTCLRQEIFFIHPANSAHGRRVSNLRQGPQGPVCGYCFFGPEITLQKRLELSLEQAVTMKHIQEAPK